MSQINLISCVKDEGPFILEWVAHHLAVGFDRILIAYNDCTDGTAELLQALARHGFVETFENISGTEVIGKQRAAYDKLIGHSIVQDADWLAVLDVDEFLNIEIGDHSVGHLTRTYNDIDFILLNARQFGSGEREKWEAGFVTEQFSLCFPKAHQMNSMAKWLARKPARAKQISNHSITFHDDEYPIHFINGDGKKHIYELNAQLPIGKFFKSSRKNDVAGMSHFSFHHYASKTLDSWALKNLRGRGAFGGMRHGDALFFEYMKNSIDKNDSIKRYRVAMRRNFDRMMTIPEIQKCHDACILNYQKRIDWVWDKLENEAFTFEDFYNYGQESGGQI